MPRPRTTVAHDLAQSLVESYAVNDRMNQLVLEHLDPRAWRATASNRAATDNPAAPGNRAATVRERLLPPEPKPSAGRSRTIAAIFSHVHNVRRKWLRLSAPHLKLPAPLSHTSSTQEQVRAALAESAARCCEMLEDALVRPESRIETFHRDGWAKPWPAGGAMLAYMLTHDAHHRGQACMLAHQLGFPLPGKAGYGLWAWERLWKECGFGHPR